MGRISLCGTVFRARMRPAPRADVRVCRNAARGRMLQFGNLAGAVPGSGRAKPVRERQGEPAFQTRRFCGYA